MNGVFVFLVGVWVVTSAWFLWLVAREPQPDSGLAEDIEVASLEFAWVLPSYREGIHG